VEGITVLRLKFDDMRSVKRWQTLFTYERVEVTNLFIICRKGPPAGRAARGRRQNFSGRPLLRLKPSRLNQYSGFFWGYGVLPKWRNALRAQKLAVPAVADSR